MISSSLLYILQHFCVCVLFFVLVQRPIFYTYNLTVSTKKTSVKDFADIIWHGLYTDVKVGAYLTAIPLLLLWSHIHLPLFNVVKILSIYNAITAFIIALLCVADTVLYKFWQYKIEASVLAYLRSPKGAFASVSHVFIVLALIAVLLVTVTLATPLEFLAFRFNFLPSSAFGLTWWEHLLTAFSAVLISALLFMVIRGLHIRPDTPVYSYYCSNPFLNHCAVNPVYNFIYSLHLKKNDLSHQFQIYDPDYCQQKFKLLFPSKGTPQLQLLTTNRPNILFVVWESLCSHFIESLGGKVGVMPFFNNLTKEGVLFTNCWAGSFRTDRGLVCILSGYLGMPTVSAILHTNKLPHLPALPRLLRDKVGYETMAVHGGQLNIFHKSDYYWASGHDRLVEERHFPGDAPATRWGIHDGYVFNWLADDIKNRTAQNTRWLTTFQTLSSHEPFQVPYSRINDNEVDNAYAYVDEAFGCFVESLKASSAWKDLLIVVTGDHGLDTNCAPDNDRNTHIPLLLLGGVVRQPMKIDTLMNQSDIAATLLGQMGLPHDDFIFSRDVLADTYTYPFAMHSFNNGFIFRDATGVTTYDNVAQQAISGHDENREETAKIILQTLYSDFDKR